MCGCVLSQPANSILPLATPLVERCTTKPELFHEWIDVLAMRRVYYLERDHWKDQKAARAKLSDVNIATKDSVQERHLFEREAWIPHPEQNDTCASVGMFCVRWFASWIVSDVPVSDMTS
jgi:hypothetical protein